MFFDSLRHSGLRRYIVRANTGSCFLGRKLPIGEFMKRKIYQAGSDVFIGKINRPV